MKIYTTRSIADGDYDVYDDFVSASRTLVDPDSPEMSKDGSEFDGFFDAEDEDEDVIYGSRKPWWRR